MTTVHPAFTDFLLRLDPAVSLQLAYAGDDGYVLFVRVRQCGVVEWLFVGFVADEWDTFDRLAVVVGDDFADSAWLAWCGVTHAEQLERRTA